MAFLARLAAALRRALSAMRGGASYLWDAVEEAVEPVTSRLPWAADKLRSAGDATLIGAGYALQAPGAVASWAGSILGSVLPTVETPRSAAAGAVAQDDAQADRPVSNMFGTMISGAAKHLRSGDEAAFKATEKYISEPVSAWLRVLNDSQLAAACRLSPAVLQQHVLAERDADRSPLLPPVSRHTAPTAGEVETQRILNAALAKAKANMRNDRSEVGAMMKRGPQAPRRQPVFEGVDPTEALGYSPALRAY